MITPAEAEETIRTHLTPFPAETCPLLRAHGRVLRADLYADRDLPPFDRATMDGYALRSASVASGVRRFRVEAVQPAGVPACDLGPASDACIEIMTGAVLPGGADAVVPYEDTHRDGDVLMLPAESVVAPGSAVHRRGSDHRAGERIVSAGCRLTGREIAVAATVGATVLTVATIPRIALVATGDELVEVDGPLAAHQLRHSNDYALRAALAGGGYTAVERFHLHDARQQVEQLLERLLAEHDILVITGGVSKGKFDLLPMALERRGVRQRIHGVAQRPGKPFWFGISQRAQPVFALPGNPVSSYTCLHRYVLPALDRASGIGEPCQRHVALTGSVTTASAFAAFLPVRLTSGSRAELLAVPCPINTSGDLAGLVGTDGFVELPGGTGAFPAGYVARFFRW